MDAIFILRSVTDADSAINPLGVLNVTIAGLFIPGHQKDALGGTGGSDRREGSRAGIAAGSA